MRQDVAEKTTCHDDIGHISSVRSSPQVANRVAVAETDEGALDFVFVLPAVINSQVMQDGRDRVSGRDRPIGDIAAVAGRGAANLAAANAAARKTRRGRSARLPRRRHDDLPPCGLSL